MKKLYSVLAMLALVGTVLSSGCKPAEDTKPVETPAPDTNAPAPAK